MQQHEQTPPATGPAASKTSLLPPQGQIQPSFLREPFLTVEAPSDFPSGAGQLVGTKLSMLPRFRSVCWVLLGMDLTSLCLHFLSLCLPKLLAEVSMLYPRTVSGTWTMPSKCHLNSVAYNHHLLFECTSTESYLLAHLFPWEVWDLL